MKLNGDRSPELLGKLIEQHREKLLFVAINILHSHSDAEDILQEASVKMLRSFSGFRGESRFITWSYRIVINQALDFLRRRKKDKTVRIGDFEWRAIGDPNSNEDLREKLIEEREQSSFIDKIFSGLSPEHRRILELRYLEGLSRRKAANNLGITVGAFDFRFFRARRNARNGGP